MELKLIKTELGTFIGQVTTEDKATGILRYPAEIQFQHIPIPGRIAGQIIGISTQTIMIIWQVESLKFTFNQVAQAEGSFDSDLDADNSIVKLYFEQLKQVWKIDFQRKIVSA